MKIVYLLPGTSLSGGVKVVLEQVIRLNQLPWIRAFVLGPGPYPTWFGRLDLPFISQDPLDTDLSSFDLIITTFFTQTKIYQKWSHKPILHFSQGYEGDYLEDLGRPDLKGQVESFYRLGQPKITVNAFLKQKLKALGPGLVFNIGQGLDHHIFYSGPINQKELSILIVGQFELPFKGLEQSLSLARQLKQKFPALKIFRASPTNTLQIEREICPIDKYYQALSPKEMASLYRRATLTIYLPQKEGFGLPVLESLACGTPVIASDLPPFREICGTQYPLFKTKEQALEGASRLLNDQEFYLALRKHGLKQAKRFSYAKVMTKLLLVLFFVRWRFFVRMQYPKKIRN